ncbi:MAG: helix-turn-helix domain-containing protein [Prevotellaceae bacterium]|jgi:two-component system phosphate regulon sensor histidine kinase PhoR|nr:helix-turn-helix domain-containing protein [Prevotellaceae bacterium]
MKQSLKSLRYLPAAVLLLMVGVQCYWLWTQCRYKNEAALEDIRRKVVTAAAVHDSLRALQHHTLFRPGGKRMTLHLMSGGAPLRVTEQTPLEGIPVDSIRSITVSPGSRVRQDTFRLPPGSPLDYVHATRQYLLEKEAPFRLARFDSLVHLQLDPLAFRSQLLMLPDSTYSNEAYARIGGRRLSPVMRVYYPYNPMMRQAVEVEVHPSPGSLLASMRGQLLGSGAVVLVLGICLFLQARFLSPHTKPGGDRDADEGIYRFGQTLFNYATNELRAGGQRIVLTSRQADILQLLVFNLHTTVARDRILEQVWGNVSYANSMALNVQISYLRKALSVDRTVHIQVVTRKGYLLEVTPTDPPGAAL